jgi:malonate-semialdehyde dehydrogenase (acetylating) / methylmalonate-semialdehyde dehydrogenase
MPVTTWRSSSTSLPIPNYVGGRWVPASTGQSLSVVNPATGDLLGHVPLSGPPDVGAAVAAAAGAFREWREVPAVERIQVLFRVKALLEQQVDDLAATLTREHGKTRSESAGELKRAIESLTHACAIPTLMMGDTLAREHRPRRGL